MRQRRRYRARIPRPAPRWDRRHAGIRSRCVPARCWRAGSMLAPAATQPWRCTRLTAVGWPRPARMLLRGRVTSAPARPGRVLARPAPGRRRPNDRGSATVPRGRVPPLPLWAPTPVRVQVPARVRAQLPPRVRAQVPAPPPAPARLPAHVPASDPVLLPAAAPAAPRVLALPVPAAARPPASSSSANRAPARHSRDRSPGRTATPVHARARWPAPARHGPARRPRSGRPWSAPALVSTRQTPWAQRPVPALQSGVRVRRRRYRTVRSGPGPGADATGPPQAGTRCGRPDNA
ncbi:hypothetical protein D3C81_1168800 [compost metagenome]